MDNTGEGSRHVGNDDEFNLGHVERIQVEVPGRIQVEVSRGQLEKSLGWGERLGSPQCSEGSCGWGHE